MDYTRLLQLLVDLEARVGVVPAAPFGAMGFVRTNGTPVQAFALDRSTRDATLPVIVALGANYTQGEQVCPRDNGDHSCVEDELGRCRRFSVEALRAYEGAPDAWHGGAFARQSFSE